MQAPTGTMKQKKGTIGSTEGKAIAKLVKASATQAPASPTINAKDHGVLVPYEHWIKKYYSEIKKDPLADLILFPKDDFTRQTFKKFQRTEATLKVKVFILLQLVRVFLLVNGIHF